MIDRLTRPLASISKSFNGSSETLKRKRAAFEVGPTTASDCNIQNAKRLKYNECPCLPSSHYSGLKSSASTAVCVPGHELQALNDSRNVGVQLSDWGSNGCHKKSQFDLQHTLYAPPAPHTSDEGSDSAAPRTTPKFNRVSMTVVKRKHFFIYTPTEGMKAATKRYFSEVYRLLDMSGSNDDCRFHPTPPHFNGKPAGGVSYEFNWRDDHASHRLSVNWGIIALVVRQQLTDPQMDGFINKSWHLSHLCGNWTCCNWRHFTVESGPINQSRNGCFNSPARCTHNPRCMKEKKRQLVFTDHIRSSLSLAVTSLGGDLSYDTLQSLEAHEIRLMEGYWENSRRGSCAFCGRSDNKAHVCSSLNSLADCKVMLKTFRKCVKVTKETGEAIAYLVKIKEDLEKNNTAKDGTLTEWMVRRGRTASQEARKLRGLKCSYLDLKAAEQELKARYQDLQIKHQNVEGSTKEAKLFREVQRFRQLAMKVWVEDLSELKVVSNQQKMLTSEFAGLLQDFTTLFASCEAALAASLS